MKTYDFGSGRTDPASFPVAELVAAAQHAIPEVGSDFVNYPGDLGHQGLREILATRESDREGVVMGEYGGRPRRRLQNGVERFHPSRGCGS